VEEGQSNITNNAAMTIHFILVVNMRDIASSCALLFVKPERAEAQ
jgi:hypothetical protein